ncbi:MAG: hypothetical protein ABIT82_04125 [Ramlibacter sp.]
MLKFVSLRSLAAAAVVLGAFGAAASAHARSDVQLSIGLGVPGVYVQPAPVYVQQPRLYYVQPAAVYVQPQPVYVQRGGAWGDRDGDGVPNIYDRHDRRHHHRGQRGYGDADRDGVPDRYDRAPNNPYYR